MEPLRLGLAGLGTVGTGVVKIVQGSAATLAARAGRPIDIVAVSARSRSKDRGVDLAGYAWEDDPVALARRPDVDVLVEVIGGEDGPAKAATEAALARGAHVVTANKAMLAHHGQALAEAAEAAGAALRFEAAVCGGIPAIKALAEGLAANEVTRVAGILNGTCNYILTRMETEGAPYQAVFDDAQRLGYLEADPTLDVGGIDAAHKLTLLAALAFGSRPDFWAVEIEGIERVSATDIAEAAGLGYRIRLLGTAARTGDAVEARIAPCLVPAASPLGQCSGVTNMVVATSPLLTCVFQGPGAGEGATASAVMGDVMDIARGLVMPPFGQPAATLATPPPEAGPTPAPYYLRFELTDRPGTLAQVAATLGRQGISIDRMRQAAHDAETAPVLIVTHPTARAPLDAALAEIAEADISQIEPVALRIER